MLVVVESTSAEKAGGRALSAVFDWIQQEESGLSLGKLDKTEVILCTRMYKYVPLWFAGCGEEIPLNDSMTYLGLTIDNSLIFRPHIATLASQTQNKVMDL